MRQGWRWGFAGQGDDLADLLGREGARTARTGLVGQQPRNLGAQALGLAREGGEHILGVEPTAPPLPDRIFIEPQGLGDPLVGFARGGAQDNLRASHQAVGDFTASRESFQHDAVLFGQVNQRGWTSHRLTRI